MSELVSRILENKLDEASKELGEANVASYAAALKRAKESSYTANETDD